MTSLHERRARGDMIQQLKLKTGINEVSWMNPQVLSSSLSQSGPARGIRGHTRRLSFLENMLGLQILICKRVCGLRNSRTNNKIEYSRSHFGLYWKINRNFPNIFTLVKYIKQQQQEY
ncbi:hypothetical protein BpHYR1_008353 [Brachionus plicatilis]|uniref:Uncharacterized protein n=1 Tax=Brachionus plicatilis TaxID=10195 RepID=A0A3M7PY14_BRAPC|nr:hypothetical protein BpHYR1_008353 [Brachionus plicatilis]